ncbi:endopeptidase catalytic subunit [Ascoidea rubescens DSM 1968]|uniref:Mitochondrial inner membrane protease subunit n=1 Tax=Ascoidea rubescens DSM 1968 TaxID=1344418 RepID=A0A1D2VM25_9ASCO|nr:catalytic subunit of the mitochondrial inner membrane peptidase complex [Ascoidea rubescens DSM 1968]ODV62663.1 catalytic subunit of the mitochondrial inner membrane peptidase complex [Ascoidea rubescens DSM 1968]
MFLRNPYLKSSIKGAGIFISWIPVVLVIDKYFYSVSSVSGSSMQPALNPFLTRKDWIFVNKLSLNDLNNIKVDDVLLIRSPTNPSKIVIKRVKGVQGDVIRTRYPYLRNRCTIPKNHLWLEGDNIRSIDSNTYGPVSTGLVIGRAEKIIYPFDRFGDIPQGGREARLSKLRAIG